MKNENLRIRRGEKQRGKHVFFVHPAVYVRVLRLFMDLYQLQGPRRGREEKGWHEEGFKVEFNLKMCISEVKYKHALKELEGGELKAWSLLWANLDWRFAYKEKIKLQIGES